MACGEPAGCHCTKEEMDKKRAFTYKVIKTIVLLSAFGIILYYVMQ